MKITFRTRIIIFIIVLLCVVCFSIFVVLPQILLLSEPIYIESFKIYFNGLDNTPMEMFYAFSGNQCTIALTDLSTGKSEYITRYNDKYVLYFDENKGSMWFMGEEYNNKDDVKKIGDISRKKSKAFKTEIYMTNKKTYYSDELAFIELVWLRYHPEDMEYLNFYKYIKYNKE